MARPVRIEYPGAVYHVVTRGNNRQNVFQDDRDRARYLERLCFYTQEKEAHLLCYCLLTNHVHLLIETPKGNLSKLMQPFQTSYTVYFNKRHGHTGHVFEQRYKAFLVDKDNYLLEVSRYIHLNAVQAGIVERPQDYPWSSYKDYLGRNEMVGMKRDVILGYFSGSKQGKIARYREFVEGVIEKKEFWEELPIVKQAFIGDEDFVEEMAQKRKRMEPVEERYRLRDIVREVCKVTGLTKEGLGQRAQDEKEQRARELLMYMARRHSSATLRDVLMYLGVRDVSTVSHGIRRAERRLKEDQHFNRQVKTVIKNLANSTIQT
ncbi:MAG: transposase [Candidatus Bathyarchaeia archaeon]